MIPHGEALVALGKDSTYSAPRPKSGVYCSFHRSNTDSNMFSDLSNATQPVGSFHISGGILGYYSMRSESKVKQDL